MGTIYKIIGGGQKIRQNIELGLSTKYVVELNSDYVEKSGVDGSDSFTNTMWSTNLNDLQEWANTWAGCNVELVESGE